MLKEFRDFIAKGSVLDLAVGVIIGAAFGKIVDSFVKDVIMPPIGMLMGKVDFNNIKIILQEAGADPKANPEVAIRIGTWLNEVVSFVIVAFCIFLVIKAANKMKKAEAEVAPAPSTSENLLGEIRDLLKSK